MAPLGVLLLMQTPRCCYCPGSSWTHRVQAWRTVCSTRMTERTVKRRTTNANVHPHDKVYPKQHLRTRSGDGREGCFCMRVCVSSVAVVPRRRGLVYL